MLDASEIAERFGLGGNPQLGATPQRGELGEVWPLQTDSGSWAVKRCFERQDETDAEQSTRIQIAGIANGVFTPSPVRSRDGALLADVGPHQVRVYDWVDLAALDRKLDAVAVGIEVARIHTAAVDGSTPGTHEWFTEPVPSAELDSTIEELSAAGAPFAAALTAHRDGLVDAATLVTPPSSLQPCHRDLFAENVRAAEGRVCVIDWDNAGAADPGYELAMVLWEFARGDERRAADLYAAYRDAGGTGRVDRPESFSMMISVASRLLHRVCRIWLDPATTPAQRYARAADVEEWIADPCSRDVIESLLNAID